MPLLQQFDPGGEIYIPFAKKKLREMHVTMLFSKLGVLTKTVQVSEGSTIYLNSLLLGNGVFKDRIRITGGVQNYWVEQGCEQPLWNIPSAVLPQMGTTIPWSPVIQHITYPYLTADSNVYETKHQLVICRYCRRVAESTWNETSTYGTNLVFPGVTLVSHTSNTVTVQLPAPNASQQKIIFGVLVPGSGADDPGVPGRKIPVMIKQDDTIYTISSALRYGQSDGDGGYTGGLYFFRLVSDDDSSGTSRVQAPTASTTGVVPITKNVIHLSEYVSNNDTDVTLYDYADNGTRTTRVVVHGLIVAAAANPWGIMADEDIEPQGSQYTVSLMGYGDPNRFAQYGSPGPQLLQGINWTAPGGRSGSITTPIFFFANPGWGSIIPEPPLSIYTSNGTTDYYQGGVGSGVFFDPYELFAASIPGGYYAADHCAWLSRQFSRARVIWDFIQSEMDKKRFGLLADLNELRPFATAQSDKLLVFSPKVKVTYTYDNPCYGTGSYVWNTSYSAPPSIPGIALTAPANLGPIPAWTYELQSPYVYTFGAPDTNAVRATTTPVLGSPAAVGAKVFSAATPSQKAFNTPYFSFGNQIINGYGTRSGFGLYQAKGKPPTTGLYKYDQATNDAQMKIACLDAGSLAYPAYSALFAPLRGAYWRRTNHTLTSGSFSVIQPAIANSDKDPLAPS